MLNLREASFRMQKLHQNAAFKQKPSLHRRQSEVSRCQASTCKAVDVNSSRNLSQLILVYKDAARAAKVAVTEKKNGKKHSFNQGALRKYMERHKPRVKRPSYRQSHCTQTP